MSENEKEKRKTYHQEESNAYQKRLTNHAKSQDLLNLLSEAEDE